MNFQFYSDVLIADPTSEEEELSKGSITVVTQEDGKMCLLEKPGEIIFEIYSILSVLTRISGHSFALFSLLKLIYIEYFGQVASIYNFLSDDYDNSFYCIHFISDLILFE